MLSGYVSKRTVALRVRDQAEPLALALSEGAPPTTGSVSSDYVNFSHLGHVIELFVQRGTPLYPVERTLLVTGVLDAAMTSRHLAGRRLETPHLDVRYAPPGAPRSPLAAEADAGRGRHPRERAGVRRPTSHRGKGAFPQAAGRGAHRDGHPRPLRCRAASLPRGEAAAARHLLRSVGPSMLLMRTGASTATT